MLEKPNAIGCKILSDSRLEMTTLFMVSRSYESYDMMVVHCEASQG